MENNDQKVIFTELKLHLCVDKRSKHTEKPIFLKMPMLCGLGHLTGKLKLVMTSQVGKFSYTSQKVNDNTLNSILKK